MTTVDLKYQPQHKFPVRLELLINKKKASLASTNMPIKKFPRKCDITLKVRQGQHQQGRRTSWEGRGYTRGGTLQENGLDLRLHFAVFILS